MKKLFLLLALLFAAIPCCAQFTSTTVNTTDTDGQAWFSGSYTITFAINPSSPGPYYFNGAPFDTTVVYNGVLNASGNFTQSLPSNTAISPSGSQWVFTIQPLATATAYVTKVSVSGATQNLTFTPPGPRFNATPGAYGYSTTEAILAPSPLPGGMFWNVTTQCLETWNNNLQSFSCSTGGGGSGDLSNPVAANAIQYVSPNGSDANSGLSWALAKADIYSAICTLPSGSCASQIAGSGTVYVAPLSAAGPTSGCGIWIMGPNDPNFSSPPACWLKQQQNSNFGTLNIIGIGNYPSGPNGHKGGRVLALWGNGNDRNHPGVWLSNAEGVYIANFGIQYPGRGFVVGECSNNDRTGTCQSTTDYLDNDTASLGLSTGGPCTDITGASFWIWMKDFGCNGLGTGASGGYLSNGAAAILVDGTGNYGPGLIYIEDSNTASGGIKAIPGNNGMSLYVNNVTQEGSGSPCAPTVWFTNFGTDSDAVVQNVYTADCSITGSSATVENDDPVFTNKGPTVMNSQGEVQGPASVFNQELPPGTTTTVSPLRNGQKGVFNGYLIGQTNVARRLSGLVSVRSSNKVQSNPSNWGAAQGSTGVTITTGQTDPFGGTGAASITTTGNQTLSFSGVGLSNYPHWTGTVGDWVVGGVWVKNWGLNQNGGIPINACPTQTGVGYSQIITNYGELLNNPSGYVDSWEFLWTAGKVSTAATFACLTAIVSSTTTPTFYGPVFYFIPQGTMTDNEVIEFATTMGSVDTSCAMGTVCSVAGHPLSVDNITLRPPSVAPTGVAGSTQFYMDPTANWPSFAPNGTTAYLIPGLVSGTWIPGDCFVAQSLPNTFGLSSSCGGSGGGNVSNSGTPTNGQLAQWINATTIQGVTNLPCTNMPTFTGDVGNSGCVTTVNGLKGTVLPSLSSGYLQYNGSNFVFSNPSTGVNTGTTGDVASYATTTTIGDSGLVAANVNSNASNFISGDLVSANGNHTTADSGVVFANVTTNSTSGTTNAIPKWTSAHILSNSAASDNGSIFSFTENVDFQTNAQMLDMPNAGSTGTTQYYTAITTGAPSTAVVALTSTTFGIIGCVQSGQGTSGSAQIAVDGEALCAFDGATTAGDYVIPSTITGGQVHDYGSVKPTTTQLIGKVLSTNASAGNYRIVVYGPDQSQGSGGGGSGTVNAASQYSAAYYSLAGTTNVVSGIAAPTGPNNVFEFWGSIPSGGVAQAPSYFLAGVPVNSSLGSTPYTMATTDRASALISNPSAPFTINLPNGGTSGFGSNLPATFKNYGTAAMTLTAPSGINLNTVSAGSLTLPFNWQAYMWQDASNNLWLSRFPDYAAFTNCSGATSAVNWSSTTGQFGCNSFTFSSIAPTPTRAGDVIYYTGSVWQTLPGNNSGTAFLSENSSGTPSWTAGTSTVQLNAIGNAGGSNTLANGNNPQVWNWAQTTNSQSAFTFGETSAATGTSDIELNVQTLAASTAFPLQVTARGTANGVQMSTTGTLAPIGTGVINANQVNSAAVPASASVVGTNASSQIVSVTVPITAGGTNATSAATGQVPNSTSSSASSWTATPTLGASGTLGSLSFGNATSGLLTIQTVTGALGTVTASFPANTGTIAELNLAQTWPSVQTHSSELIASAAGAASTPGLLVSGNAYTAGSTTTNFPQFYINNGATGPSTFSAAGTQFGINATSGFTGNLIDLHVNGAGSVFSVSSTGSLTVTSCSGCGSVSLAFPLAVSGTTNSGGIPYFSNATTLSTSAALTANAIVLGGGAGVAPATNAGFTTDGTSKLTLGVAGTSTGQVVFNSSGAGGSNTVTPGTITAAYTTTLPANTGTVMETNFAQTVSAAQTNSYAGTASTPAQTFSGAPFTGGTGTTTFPQFLMNNGASNPTTWSTSGTYFGVNSASGFTGNYFDLRVNGAGSVFNVNYQGNIAAAQLLATGIVDGQAPITITTGSTATLGGTYNGGYTFNQNATAATAITYTLPVAAAGKQYCVKNSYNGSAADTGVITLQTSAAGQSIIFNGTAGASDGYLISGGAAGDAACVVGISATQWEAYVQVGTWTVH